MKQNQLISMLMFAALCSTTLQARDIYVYNGSNIKPVGSSQNVQKIAFNSNGMSVTTVNGAVTTFLITNFDYFTFFQRSTTGIKQSQSSFYNIFFDGTNINIKCLKNIDKISIFNASGTAISTFSPKTKSVSYNLTSLPSGVYLIKAVTDDNVFSQKIIK